MIQKMRPRLRLFAVWISIALACLAAYVFQSGDTIESINEGFAAGVILTLIVAAGILVTTLLDTGEGDDAHTDLTLQVHPSRTRSRTRWLPTLLGVVLLALLAEISGNVFDPSWLRHVHYHVQAVMLVVGVGLLAYGMAGQPLPSVPSPMRWRGEANNVNSGEIVSDNPPTRDNWTRGDTILLLLILLLALVLRVWRLSAAVHLFVDEVHFTNPITHFDDANDIGLLLPFSSVAAFPYLYPYLQWNLVQVFGYNLVGLRMLSAIFGVMNVAALIFLARQLFDGRTGWIAGVLLAVLPVHLQYSRLGLNNAADPVFGTLALAFISSGLRSEGRRTLRRDFAYAGAMLGLTQYWYEGGRLLFPPLVLLWGVVLLVMAYGVFMLRLMEAEDAEDAAALIRRANRINWRPLIQAVLVLMVVTVLVSAPVYYTLFGQGKSVVTRLETAGVGGDKRFIDIESLPELLGHFQKQFHNAGMLHVSLPENAHYYRGTTAMLLPVIVPFFLLGLCWVVFHLHTRAGASLVLVWIGLTIVGNLLMQDSRITARYVVSFPAMMLVATLGLRWTAQVLTNSRRMQNMILIGLVLGLAIVQPWYYFNRHLPTFNEQFREKLGIDSHDVLFRAARYKEPITVMIIAEKTIPERDAADYMDYLNPIHSVIVTTPEAFDAEAAAQIRRDTPYAFFIDPDDIITTRRLYAFFPQSQGPFFSPFDVPKEQQFALYFAAQER